MKTENNATEESTTNAVLPTNEEKLVSLEKQLAGAGLSDIPREDVIDLIKENKQELTITRMFDQDKVDVKANFRHDLEKGKVYLNSYDFTLTTPGQESAINKNVSCYYGNTYTVREMHKLATGASVHKKFYDSETKKWEEKWAYADFGNTDKEGNFLVRRSANYDLQNVLSKYPIPELDNLYQKANIMDTLKSGNAASATMDLDGKPTNITIQANAKFKTVNLYKEDGSRILLTPQKKQKQEQSTDQNVSQDKDQQEKQGQQQKNGNEPKTAEKRSRKRGNKIS